MIDVPPHIAREVLNLPMQENDADAPTVKDYLLILLGKLWTESEDFNTKRPFGNSGWQREIKQALAAGGVMDVDAQSNPLILAAIRQLGEQTGR